MKQGRPRKLEAEKFCCRVMVNMSRKMRREIDRLAKRDSASASATMRRMARERIAMESIKDNVHEA